MAILDNIVAYWKLDESSGNAADSVSGYTATNTNVTYADAKINNGAVYDTNNDYLSPGDAANLKFSGAHSLNAWINLGGANRALYDMVFFKGNDGVDFWCIALHWTGTNTLRYAINANRANNAQTQLDCTAITVDSNWHMVTATYSGTVMKVYWDGTEIGTKNATQSIDTTGSWYFGNTNGGRSVNKKLDELGMWSRALSSTEVTALYNSGNGIQYPFAVGPANLKSFNGLAKASIKSINGLAIASVKSVNGLA